MFKAKAGLLGLDQYDRKISTKGSIADIRRHSDEAIPYGGIPQLANLGSQNAISGTNDAPPVIVRLTDAIEKLEGTEAKFIKSVDEKIINPKKTLGEGGFAEAGKGGTQSAESKRVTESKIANEEQLEQQKIEDERRKVQPPSVVPPFLLDNRGTSPDFVNWVKYLEKKFPKEQASYLIRKTKTDSIDYAQFRRQMHSLSRQVREWNNDWRSHILYLNNFLISVGDMLVEQARSIIKDKANKTISPEEPKKEEKDTKKEEDPDYKKELTKLLPTDYMIDSVVNYVKTVLPKKTVPFPEQVKAFYDKVFALHPSWKAKLTKESNDNWKKFIDDLTGDIDI